MDFVVQLSKEFKWPQAKVGQVVQLLEEGNTIPFIARYRKEATGEMDEVMLRDLFDRLNYLKNLAARKEEVIRIIDEQGKLTEELAEKIDKATVLQEVEDLYRPYRQKRRTRASIAKERGLEGLAQIIIDMSLIQGDLVSLASEYINPELEVNTYEEALAGARDIVAEIVAEESDLRQVARELYWKDGVIVSRAVDAAKITPYEMYYEYREPVSKIPAHRILALNRGEKEEALKVSIDVNEELMINTLVARVAQNPQALGYNQLIEAISDGYKRLLGPSLERETRNTMTEQSEEQAIKIFSKNLHNLLLQPPVRNRVVLGVDPGYRTGCKTAVVDDTGKLLDKDVIYPHPPQKKWDEAKAIIRKQIKDYGVNTIAIGNGTASRESENLVAEIIGELPEKLQYIIVSEAGASVYSASPIAKEEFPDFDLSLRSAISIARRLQDPLAELVKIEPKAIGVGQYQHDVNPKRLQESLHGVVESCVNTVGVDINTASAALLQYIAGLSQSVAKNIVAKRDEEGKFIKREQLLKVPRLGPKAFQQCAGFLRIVDGINPLENTPVHPESYELASAILEKAGFTLDDLKTEKLKNIQKILPELNLQQLAQELQGGIPTIKDIIDALQKPGRDPREELPPPLFRTDVVTLEDLKEGMVLQGTIRNVVDFGAFVDIGVKQDGLVHLSQLSNKYVKHPTEVVAVGDIVKVKVLSVDLARGRVSLSMKLDE